MKELLSLLGNIYPLSPPLHKYLAEKIKTRTITKKFMLLEAGTISRHIYFINEGLLRCYYIEYGQEICSKFMKEGDFLVSGSSFFLRQKSHEYIQAIENCQLCSLCYDELQFMYKHFPEINIISRTILTKSYLSSEQRLFFIRMKQATDRYNMLMTHYPELILRVPAKYIASYLGISEETLSRIRSKKY